MPKPIPTLSDAELALSMLVFMQEQGAERMLRATAEACRLYIQERPHRKNDWKEAVQLVENAAKIIKHGNPNQD